MPKMKYFDYATLIDQIISRNHERKIFTEFLDSRIDGKTIAEHLYHDAKDMSLKDHNHPDVKKEELVEAIIKRYKTTQVEDGRSAYEEMVFDLIAEENNQRELINKMKTKKITLNNLPTNFPSMRKNAETIFRGKVFSDITPEDCSKYKTEKYFISILREYARDLFFVLNNEATEKAVNFLRLMYSLNQIKTFEPSTLPNLRKILLEHMKKEDSLEIIHIKSIRFTYPKGTNLKVLEDTAPVVQSGLKDEIRKYPSEEVIFERMGYLRKLLETSGIKTKATVIVSDHDLDYCFPETQNIVPNGDVERGKLAAKNYVENLRKLHPEIENIRSLTEFLKEKKIVDKFETMFKSLVREGEQGGGRFISEKILEMRVNEQFEHYNQMFDSYSRKLARQTAISQISNLLSLSVIFESFPSIPLLTIDSRGFEDNLIGGCNPNSVVKFFTKLKDSTETKRNNV
ncbi:MAG: hypothetical protein Q7R97_02080 [Candidatus Daviesbacteria bacterium]|nr:hypothetical protein [Candidatus Daviesbacteria bacterium]